MFTEKRSDTQRVHQAKHLATDSTRRFGDMREIFVINHRPTLHVDMTGRRGLQFQQS